MSEVFHGVVVRCLESDARTQFNSLDCKVPLRMVRLDDDVFGVYTGRQHTPRVLERITGELQRIAAQLSRANGAALFYSYDSRVGPWYQLFEVGEMTREDNPMDRSGNTWGKGHPLEAIGASRSLNERVDEAFLYDILDPLVESSPKWSESKWRL